MCSLGWEVGGGCLGVAETTAQVTNSWQCQLDPVRGYTAQGAYQLLTSQQHITLAATEELTWHKQVALKISILAWRLLRDRLPTKSNLVAIGIITPRAHLCVSGCGCAESAEHIFLSCSTFSSLWPLVRSWIDFSLVQTIMYCVTTVSFSILVNGQASNSFRPERGIRQGDPLSTYLFIICANVLSRMLTAAQDQSLINERKEACQLMTVFDEYQRISGQKINMDKSEMTFNPHTYHHIKEEFQAIMPLQVSSNISKYLGMPTHIGRSKQEVFNFIMDKVRNKLKGWKEKHLSFAGRGVVISVVVQAIPTYIMSCFLIPKHMCQHIEKTICKFWWGSNESNHKIHWKAMKDLFKPKFDGGMGFRNMQWFNLAMLAKKAWRLQTNPTSLLGKCLKARYYPNSDIIHAQQGRNTSYAWQSIHHGIWVINKGSCWKICDGQKVNLWEDNWIPQQNGYKLITPHNGHDNISKLRDIMVFEPSKGWNHTIIDQTVLPFEGELIKQIPLILEKTETMNHVFMDCQYATKIWFGSKLGVRFATSHRDFAERLVYSVIYLNNNDLRYIAAIIYGMWYARNQLIFEFNDIEDNTIINLASKWLNEYQNTNTKDTKVSIDSSTYVARRQTSDRNRQHHNANQTNRWKKPIQGMIKINCDANLAVEGRWGLGVLCHDSEGEILAAATWEIPGAADPILAEACALYNVVKLALDCGFFEVLIESDCSKVIDLVKEDCRNPKLYLGDFIRGFLCNKSKFRYCNFGHIRRKANKAAHALASLAHSEHNRVWLEEAHPTLVPILLMDSVL
ncbi:hypothetical protein TSUD_395260 [Trifolium subterraneum]|uniref:RNase H type-1 domain-containing protein n=1 Tax=Trifolium subterraneum TaxID=3900 RepID=A0A2Z6NN81_TRISU|nr:hypothetical protein TSUD_395260 [Trifolium subterraneum]